MLLEPIKCKLCGETEEVQIGIELHAANMCYSCEEEHGLDAELCTECEDEVAVENEMCESCLEKQMKEWEEEQKAQYRDWCNSRF